MGKAKILVDKKQLQQQIDLAEQKGTFENLSKLFEVIVQTDWAKNQKDSAGNKRALEIGTIANRVKEFGIVTKTQQGKRGNPNISKTPRNRGESMKQKSGYNFALSHLKVDFKKDSQKKKLSKLIEKGSLKAAIALKCEECCCGVVAEARRCTVYGCPLWLVSPYTGHHHDKEVSNEPVEIGDEE